MQTMLKWIFITNILLYSNHIEHCIGNSHTITGPFYDGYDGFTYLKQTLFTRNTTVPKSYVVGFKYTGDYASRVINSGTISSDAQNTRGSGDLSNGFGLNDTKYLNAEIHIPNATKFNVDIELHGMLAMGYTGMERWLRLKIFRPRSFALICALNKRKSHTQYRELVFGQRNDNDTILYARIESFASSNSELPRHRIEFEDNSAILTSVTIKLNSTRAIVFHNKVQLMPHRFSATIYGLNRDTITAVLIIYGRQT